MIRSVKASLLACLATSVLVGSGATAGAVPAPTSARPAVATASAPETPLLVGVRAASHRHFDRVVWQFRGGLPASRQVRVVPELLGDESGEHIRAAGATFLWLITFPAAAHDDTGATAPGRVVVGAGNVIEVVRTGDFEGVVGYGVGLAKRQPFRMFTLRSPDRIVIDVRKDYRQATRSVTLLNQKRFSENTAPFTQRVNRRVPAAAPAHAVLHQLFAGPRPSERRRDLRTVRSGATGFTKLTISANKVARVQLTGGCDSGGSTFTVADLIGPTLKQFHTVRWVKIYDPKGRTEQPTGRRDSIPTCLEP
jgi:hypothetical protein